jgi:hypothetical protein
VLCLRSGGASAGQLFEQAQALQRRAQQAAAAAGTLVPPPDAGPAPVRSRSLRRPCSCPLPGAAAVSGLYTAPSRSNRFDGRGVLFALIDRPAASAAISRAHEAVHVRVGASDSPTPPPTPRLPHLDAGITPNSPAPVSSPLRLVQCGLC